MENKSHAFAAGAFVLAVSALLVVLAIWLTRDTGEHRVYELSSRDAVTGLQPQAAVRFRGVTVGKVTAIGFDPETPGNVLIRISTDDMAPITRSTFATLGFQGVTGLAFVQLDDTGESKQALVSTDAAIARIPMRPSLLSKLADQGTNILAQLEETSRRVNQLLAPENQKALVGAVQGIGQAAVGIEKFSARATTVLDAQFGPERMNLPKLVQDMTGTLKSVQTMTDTIGTSADEVRASAKELKTLSEAVTKAGGPLDKLGEGADALSSMGQSLNVGTLPRLNRTTDEATRAARQVSRTVNAVNDNPQSLIYGNGPIAPGPGEPGFTTPGGKP